MRPRRPEVKPLGRWIASTSLPVPGLFSIWPLLCRSAPFGDRLPCFPVYLVRPSVLALSALAFETHTACQCDKLFIINSLHNTETLVDSLFRQQMTGMVPFGTKTQCQTHPASGGRAGKWQRNRMRSCRTKCQSGH